MGKSSDEFPMLGALGLYAAPTSGAGNCLFYSLSDQLYGDQSHHLEIRSRVVAFMAQHANYFKRFAPVNIGGGERRNPRREAASKYSTIFDFHVPTEADVDRQYELRLQNMAKYGTYGDHMEIMAFSATYGVHVKVYQAPGIVSDVTGATLRTENDGLVESVETPTAHIAYHSYEHYSSIRSTLQPHIGLFQEGTPIEDTSSSQGAWTDYSSRSSSVSFSQEASSDAMSIEITKVRHISGKTKRQPGSKRLGVKPKQRGKRRVLSSSTHALPQRVTSIIHDLTI